MCNGYWEACNCEDCNRAKELYNDIEYYWDNKEAQEEAIKELESMGYSYQPIPSYKGGYYGGTGVYKKREVKDSRRIF